VKVAIDLTPAVKRRGGIGRYAEELTRALVSLDDGIEYQAFYLEGDGAAPRPPLDTLPRITDRSSDRAWRARVGLGSWLGLSYDRRFGDIDLFHGTDHLLPPLRKIKTVFTILDLTSVLFPHTQSFANRMYSRAMLPAYVHRADALIAISESTKRDAMAAWGLADNRIHAIPLGVREGFCPQEPGVVASVKARLGIPPRYLLWVGTIEPRKNLETLYVALAQMRVNDVPLVVAGRKGWLYQHSFEVLAREGVANRVHFTGPVADEDLPALYSGAEAFVFPSWYEGFGLPVLEAMACGAPVVASDRSSLPEVAGAAGILVPPEDPRAWADALDELLENPERRPEWGRKGRARAAEFTWEKVARATRDVYRGVCDGRS